MGGRTAEVVRTAGGAIVRSRTRVYDEFGRLLQAVGAASQVTAFAYDEHSNLTALTDGVSNRFTVSIYGDSASYSFTVTVHPIESRSPGIRSLTSGGQRSSFPYHIWPFSG